MNTRRGGLSRPASPANGDREVANSQSKLPHSSLDIELVADKFYFRGVGSAAEPCLVAGEVILTLSEATSLREVYLHLKGKARIPSLGANETQNLLHSNYNSTVVYSHDGSFLAGDKRAHTLKAGRHTFPFQVELEPNVPSSLTTRNAYLGISYKFRATAVRATTFSTNLHAQCPLVLLRSLNHDALEYQQTLEIENTWSEKIMYSLMIPHKVGSPYFLVMRKT